MDLEKIYKEMFSVNLPRWGLKPTAAHQSDHYSACKFTSLGFETLPLITRSSSFISCKFTPLGFETYEHLGFYPSYLV